MKVCNPVLTLTNQAFIEHFQSGEYEISGPVLPGTERQQISRQRDSKTQVRRSGAGAELAFCGWLAGECTNGRKSPSGV